MKSTYLNNRYNISLDFVVLRPTITHQVTFIRVKMIFHSFAATLTVY